MNNKRDCIVMADSTDRGVIRILSKGHTTSELKFGSVTYGSKTSPAFSLYYLKFLSKKHRISFKSSPPSDKK